METAFSEIGLKIRKVILKLFFQDHVGHRYIQGSKARRIGDICILTQGIKLHMAGRVLSAAQLFTDRAGFDMRLGQQGIE